MKRAIEHLEKKREEKEAAKETVEVIEKLKDD